MHIRREREKRNRRERERERGPPTHIHTGKEGRKERKKTCLPDGTVLIKMKEHISIEAHPGEITCSLTSKHLFDAWWPLNTQVPRNCPVVPSGKGAWCPPRREEKEEEENKCWQSCSPACNMLHCTVLFHCTDPISSKVTARVFGIAHLPSLLRCLCVCACTSEIHCLSPHVQSQPILASLDATPTAMCRGI